MTATFEAVLNVTVRIFSEVFGNQIAELKSDATSQTIAGWDSFKYIQVIVAIENEYRIEPDGSDIDDVENVGDLAELVLAKVRTSEARPGYKPV